MKTSKSDRSTQQLTLRLPEPMVRAVKLIAKRRQTTVNALLVSLVEQCELDERELELRRAYEMLGQDSDVGFASTAQREVVSRG